jgi:hypothetical protein
VQAALHARLESAPAAATRARAVNSSSPGLTCLCCCWGLMCATPHRSPVTA